MMACFVVGKPFALKLLSNKKRHFLNICQRERERKQFAFAFAILLHLCNPMKTIFSHAFPSFQDFFLREKSVHIFRGVQVSLVLVFMHSFLALFSIAQYKKCNFIKKYRHACICTLIFYARILRYVWSIKKIHFSHKK